MDVSQTPFRYPLKAIVVPTRYKPDRFAKNRFKLLFYLRLEKSGKTDIVYGQALKENFRISTCPDMRRVFRGETDVAPEQETETGIYAMLIPVAFLIASLNRPIIRLPKSVLEASSIDMPPTAD
jgi:hypothetical protein